MRHVVLPALLALLAVPATASAFTDSQSQAITSNGQNFNLSFTGLPTGSGNVTLTIGLQGDFSYGDLSNPEGGVITADSVNLGTFIPANDTPPSTDCDGTVYMKTFTFSTSLINNNNAVTIGIDLYPEVNNFCGQQSVSATIAYTDNTAPTVTTAANQTLPEDTSGSASVTVSDAEDADGAVVLTATSSNASLLSSLSTSNTNGAGTISWVPTMNATGTTTITVTATDSGALTDTSTFDLTLTPVNDPPVADAGGPYAGAEGSAITMDGSLSADVDDAITGYSWDCDNNGVFEVSVTGPTDATCAFDDEGTYTVGLIATDASGADSAPATATVTVSNVAPTLVLSGPTATDEGTGVFYAATATDPSGADSANLTYDWSVTYEGVLFVSATNAGTSFGFTPTDDGIYFLTGTVTDPAGAFDTESVTLTVANVAPVATIGGPSTGFEGSTINWTFPLFDAGAVDNAALTNAWMVQDAAGALVTSGSGTAGSWTPPDDGVYTLTSTATDPQGATGAVSLTVVIANVDPTLDPILSPASGDEGSAMSWVLSGSDPSPVDSAALLFGWVITDATGGTVASGSDATPAWTFADDGAYTLTGTVTDPQASADTSVLNLTINNVDPVVTSLLGPIAGDEGSLLSYSATTDDVGTGDLADLVLSWDWGDGSAVETGLALDHTYADDGAYTVTVVLDDQDGGTDSETLTVVVGNVAPVIDTTPATAAPQGSLYSYAPAVTDPGAEVFAWTLSASAPAGMTVDAATGALQWTPSYAQALVGSYPVTLTVDDGDGGVASQSWTLIVTVSDDDGDGLADGWELENGLDPTDPNDASGDPDADGLTNLDEFTEGTNPNSYDGPSAPVLVEPIASDEVSDTSPDLFFDNATDPQNEVLTYTLEVYSDSALTTLVTSTTGLAETPLTSTWKVDIALTENASYWWRARATDAWVDGPWTTEESFVVNAVNESPDVPVLSFPIGGETAASASPILSWAEALDIDGDAVSYDVEVYDVTGALVTMGTGAVGDGISATWQVDVALAEDFVYSWTVRSVDEHGLESDWAEEEEFFVSADNGAPSNTIFVRPVAGDDVVSLSPELEATVSVDPEGGAVTYEFELDTVQTFDSGEYLSAALSEPMWDLAGDSITLTEETVWYGRVRAVDEAGITSVPDTTSFFVRGENDAPEVPVLSAPDDASSGESNPVLTVLDPVDPEGDLVFVDFLVARDAELTDVITEVSGVVVSGEGTTSWAVDVNLQGTVYWTARASDGEASSEWAQAWSYVAPSSNTGAGDDDDDDDTTAGGCDCAADIAAGPSNGLAVLALLLPLLAVRRRRS